jgi:NitT/TauT family transport system substrate-binding protein
MNCKSAILAALAAIGLSTQSAHALDKVTFGYPLTISIQHSDYFFGQKMGFFKEEGIEVEFLSFQGTPVVAPQVANKSITFGSADSSYLISAIAKGEPLPIKFVYNYVRRVSNDIAVLNSSPIKGIGDLKGKKLGVGSTSFITQTLTKAVLASAGVAWSDIEVLPIGLGPAAWKQLDTGVVDAVNFFRSEDAKMRLSGLDIRQIFYPEQFSKIFVASILAHEDTIRDNPDLIARMGRAMAKSSVACLANKQACARAYWDFDPSSKPLPENEAKWISDAIVIIDANYESVGYFHDGKEAWGSFPDKALAVYIDAMKANEIIPAATSIDENALYTNQFVDEFNKFDKAAVEAAAKAAK